MYIQLFVAYCILHFIFGIVNMIAVTSAIHNQSWQEEVNWGKLILYCIPLVSLPFIIREVFRDA